MNPQLMRLLDLQRGVATSGQILGLVTRYTLEAALKNGVLERIWPGIYCLGEPTEPVLLRGLDLAAGTRVATCLTTAAAMHGFDTEGSMDLHVLNPPRHQLRSVDGLVVHRREGAPLTVVEVDGDARYLTSPAWTAVEVARALRRPRALATLDAALRSGTCSRTDLWRAALDQAGRRGIVAVRNLIALADPRAESPMESESRLMMIDAGLPMPELQYEVIDGRGQLRRLDFAWPDCRVAVEYDGEDWHNNPEALRNDRQRAAALMEVGWSVLGLVSEDVRLRAQETVGRIDRQLSLARAA
ncbi:DUF559 domain-containing protein [Mycolicibacterium goodii]|uniref:DUF559 domain-containing protein n=1 Tax=Mycolicibacterium goodii TaxID=134601 RepID=A0A0K0XDN3_MYCGD|nr:hypothetical protein AFA91_30340 [Mycolicibacterium goodii]